MKTLNTVFLGFFLIFLSVFATLPQVFERDTGWLIAQFHWMLAHHSIYQTDIFNYANASHSFVPEYPVFEILFGLSLSLGVWGPNAFQALLLGLVYLPLFFFARKHPINPWFLPIVLIGFLLSLPRLVLRPEMVTMVGTVLFSLHLLHHRKTPQRLKLIGLFMGQFLWTNSHSGFIAGPVLVAGFALENAWQDRSLRPLRAWLPAIGVVILACCCNPAGPERFFLPFYHQESAVIRLYVSEMQPLSQTGLPLLLQGLILLLLLAAGAWMTSAARLPWTFLTLFLAFSALAVHSQRHLALAALFALLTVLPWQPRRPTRLLRFTTVTTEIVGILFCIFGLWLLLDRSSPVSISRHWQRELSGQGEYPMEAVTWLESRHFHGRLFHHCDIGGRLQQDGFNDLETFADAGFGKFSESFIRDIGLAANRPGTLPALLKKYAPDAVLASINTPQWPAQLLKSGWRCVFYSAPGSVWVPAAAHPEWSTPSPADILRSFRASQRQPLWATDWWNQRRYLALNSFGFSRETWELWRQSHRNNEDTEGFWSFATSLCFQNHPVPLSLINEINILANEPKNLAASLRFRALLLNQQHGSADGADLLQHIPPEEPDDLVFSAWAHLYLEQNHPEAALAILENDRSFTITCVSRRQLQAQCLLALKRPGEAAQAYQQAIFLAPDDADLRREIAAFLAHYPEPRLQMAWDQAAVWITLAAPTQTPQIVPQ